MTTPENAPGPADLDTMLDIARRFEEAGRSDPALAQVRIGELLRLAPGKRAVIAGEFNERPAIIRLHLSGGPGIAAAEWAEMQRLWSYMATGPHRVAQPFHCNAESGILVLERIAGTPLLQALWQSDPGARMQLIDPAIGWLRRCTAGHEEIWPEGRRYWLKRAEEMRATQTHRWLKRLETDLLAELTRIGKLIRRNDWRTAIGHGDFHAGNLIAGEDHITAIDTGASSQLPIYKDMSRFLTHMARRGMRPSGATRYGVDQASVARFAEVFELSPLERDVMLPFMIGIETLIRVEPADAKRIAIRRAAEMTEGLLEDLRQI